MKIPPSQHDWIPADVGTATQRKTVQTQSITETAGYNWCLSILWWGTTKNICNKIVVHGQCICITGRQCNLDAAQSLGWQRSRYENLHSATIHIHPCLQWKIQSKKCAYSIQYNIIQYCVYLMSSPKLMGGQLNLLHRFKEKLKRKTTKNKLMSTIKSGPVQRSIKVVQEVSEVC